MGFRFRKSYKIGPGLRLNFGKRGMSLSLGRRAFTNNISKQGVRRHSAFRAPGCRTAERWARRNKRSVTDQLIAAPRLGMVDGARDAGVGLAAEGRWSLSHSLPFAPDYSGARTINVRQPPTAARPFNIHHREMARWQIVRRPQLRQRLIWQRRCQLSTSHPSE
jgi:hypothetical protein